MANSIAYVGRGTKVYVKNPVGGAYVEITQVEEVGLPRAVKDEIDITNLSSTGKEFLVDLPDFGEAPITEIANPAAAHFAILETLNASGDITDWRVVLSDVDATQLDFSGRIKERGPEPVTQGTPLKWTTVVRVSGTVVIS
jgi:hypothetical protein